MTIRHGLIALLLAWGCSHAAPPPPPGPAPDERFTLRTGESAAIRGTLVKITFERILSDSRCAVDVVCIQAGEAVASFRVDAGRGGGTDTFVLDTSDNSSAVVSGYRVSLVSVSPAPRSTVRIEPRSYVIDLTVSPENGSSPPS